jgi:hypothetical protein
MFERMFSKAAKAERRLAEEIEILRKSPLLDPVWYRQTYADLRHTPVDVARHYLEHGAAEGRNPGPLFDTKFYLKQNPDVAASEANPLVHYVLHGEKEGRALRRSVGLERDVERIPVSTLDAAEFAAVPKRAADKDAAQVGGADEYDANPQRPNPSLLRFFDADWYRRHNLSPLSIQGDPLDHYLKRGHAMGLVPHPWFRPAEYYSLFDDVAQTGATALEHFLARVDRSPKIDNCVSLELRLALRDMLAARRRRAPGAAGQAQISFVVPVYNGGAFLEDAIISALLSTIQPCEIIIVNDGSTDAATLSEIQRLESAYQVIVIHKENGGLSSARNTGASHVSSPAVKFLDCDDLLWPGSSDLQLEQVLSSSRPKVSIGEYHFCGRDGGHWTGPDTSTIEPFPFTEESFFMNWENGFSIPIHCALFPSELVRSHRFSESVRAKEDWLFWMEISASGWQASYLPNLVALYRIHGANMCSNPEAMGLEYLRAAMFHATHDAKRANHAVTHFAKAYLGSIKAAVIQK